MEQEKELKEMDEKAAAEMPERVHKEVLESLAEMVSFLLNDFKSISTTVMSGMVVLCYKVDGDKELWIALEEETLKTMRESIWSSPASKKGPDILVEVLSTKTGYVFDREGNAANDGVAASLIECIR